MVTTMTQESTAPDQEKSSIWSTINILAISGIMLTIGIIWRIVDQFVLGLGDTWMNILPSKLFPLLIMMGFFWFYRCQEIESVLGLSLKNLRVQLAVGLVMGILVSVLIDTGGTVVYTLLLDPSYPLDLHIINGELLGYLFIFFLINAFLEEALFRGLIQNSLKTKFTPSIAITLSAVMFGIWHSGWPIVNAASGESALVEVFMIVFFTTILGLLFGIYYEKFSSGQSLMGLVVAHTIFNFVNECFKIGPEPIMQGPDMGFATPGLMVVTLIMFFLTFSILFLVFWRYRIEQVSALWCRFTARMRKS